MGINSFAEHNFSPELELLINTCKSNSGECGLKLRKAHHRMGQILGTEIAGDNAEAERYAAVIMMRAGLPFGMGMADAWESAGRCVQIFFSTKEKELPDDLTAVDYDRIVLVDAVIKTGKSMIALAEKLGAPEKIIYATNVMDETGKPNFADKQVYTIRTSKHSFTGAKQKEIKGGKGPDTGDRLFNSGFMK